MLGVLFETVSISYVIIVEYRRVIGRRRPLVAAGETLQSSVNFLWRRRRRRRLTWLSSSLSRSAEKLIIAVSPDADRSPHFALPDPDDPFDRFRESDRMASFQAPPPTTTHRTRQSPSTTGRLATASCTANGGVGGGAKSGPVKAVQAFGLVKGSSPPAASQPHDAQNPGCLVSASRRFSPDNVQSESPVKRGIGSAFILRVIVTDLDALYYL